MEQRSTRARGELARRLWSIAFGLLILGAAWYLLHLDGVVTGVIGGLIIVAGILPPVFGNFVGAAGFFGLAGLIYFYYAGGPQVPILLTIVGVVFLGSAALQASKGRRVYAGQG
jgi:hypothetical protein